jgi:quinolinate synthase
MALSLDATYAMMRDKLHGLVPEFELEHKAELAYEINKLKEERNAIILGHNYMEPALFHAVADITGDSLELCRKAAATDKDIIVFCGVEFMAETAKILNPTRKVLIPSKKAGCSLAQSITAADVRQLREQFPGVPVVTYINSYADVKAETDICCTSGNAVKIVNQLDSDQVIFIPDEFLAKNVAKQTGKTIIFPENRLDKAMQSDPSTEGKLQKVFIGWHGRCEVHELFTVEDIQNVRQQYPDVVVLAHPECPPEVVDASDFSGSTSAMIKYVQEVKAPRYLLLTECAMADNVIAANRDKELLRLCSHRCPHMAQITLQDTLDSLKNLQHEIHLEEGLRLRAKRSIDRMLEMS